MSQPLYYLDMVMNKTDSVYTAKKKFPSEKNDIKQIISNN